MSNQTLSEKELTELSDQRHRPDPLSRSTTDWGRCCLIAVRNFFTHHHLFFFLTMVLALNLSAADTEPLSKTVDYLVGQVEKADGVKFIRNGDEHTGREAAEHMRRKYNHFKKEIKTPEDFIEKCAAKSELSGKPYLIKKSDGTTGKCQDWMKSILEEHRKSADAKPSQ